MKNTMILSATVLFLFVTGCASQSLFPTNGSHPVTSESEFGVLTAQPDMFQGRAVKLAGRMVGVETTAEGTIVTAEWLPYPNVEYEGPTNMGMASPGRFVLFYPGKLDAEGSLPGNKFLVVGKKDGSQSKGILGKSSPAVPHIMARCLHVWKTGDDDIEVEPDSEYPGLPFSQETYCSGT